jgi:hypothetical protein
VRLALRERGDLTAEALGDLEVCAGAVLDWLESTGDGRWALRALWRLVEIEELSRAAGHELDSAPLHRRLRRFVAPFLQKRPAGEGSAEPRER